MKKIIFSLALILMGNIHGAYLENVPQTFTQPDGTVIQCFATGDEFYNWLHDENNYTIIRDHSNGYYVYAQLENNKLVPTKHIVGVVNPKTTEIKPAINLKPAKIQEIRVNANEKYFNPGRNRLAKQTGPFSYITKGVLNNIVIFISFTGQSGWTETLEDYERVYNSPNEYSMYNFYQENSDGQLDIQSYFFPKPVDGKLMSYVDSHPIDYYFEYDSTTNPIGYLNDGYSRFHNLLQKALESVQNQIETSNINVDQNNDSYIDAISFVIKDSAWKNYFWPHRGQHYGFLLSGSIHSYQYIIQENIESQSIDLLNVYLHEMGHILGAPDMYSQMWHWSMMSKNTGNISTHVKRKYFDWFEKHPLIESSGSYELLPVSTAQFSSYKIKSPYSNDEYFLLEYRQTEGKYDARIPDSGLIVMRANPYRWGNQSGIPYELYLFYPIYGDPWWDREYSNFSANVGRTMINGYTNPAILMSDSTRGGINITNIGYAGETIQFDVHFPSSTIDFLDIEQFDEGLLELKWNLVFEDWVKQYNVYRSIGNSNNFEKIGIVEHPYTIFEDTTLVNNSNYYYKISVVDNSDFERAFSSVVHHDLQLPDAIPENLLTIINSHSSIKIEWDKSSKNWIKGYRIYRKVESETDYTIVGETTLSYTIFEDNHLIPNTKYNYKITSIDFYNNERGSSEVYVQLPNITPINLNSSAMSEGRSTVKWNLNIEKWIKYYRVYRREEIENDYIIIGEVGYPDTTFEDSNLVQSKLYYYRVTCIDYFDIQGNFSETTVKAFSQPTSSDKIIEINEDAVYVFQTTDFAFIDVDKHSFAGLIISKLPDNAKGKLLYNQSIVIDEQVIANITQLQFEPAENQFGSPFTDFSFQVIDSSGDKSIDNYTFTISVLPVNDSPNDFYLEFPINNDTLKVTNTNLLEDFVFKWTASGDVENENILYDFVGSGGIDFLSSDSINTNEVSFDVKYITSKIKSSSSSSGTWIVIATDGKGNTKAVNGPFTLVLDATKIVINKYNLEQNFPNPFNSRTTIIYTLPIDTNVKIEIFDINGKNIYTLINEYQESGIKVLNWDGRDRFGNTVNSGIYFYRIVSNKFVKTRKLLFLK